MAQNEKDLTVELDGALFRQMMASCANVGLRQAVGIAAHRALAVHADDLTEVPETWHPTQTRGRDDLGYEATTELALDEDRVVFKWSLVSRIPPEQVFHTRAVRVQLVDIP